MPGKKPTPPGTPRPRAAAPPGRHQCDPHTHTPRRPQAADVTCPVPWVMNAPTVGCLACGKKLEYAYTAMASTPWQVVAFENHTPQPVTLAGNR